MSNDHWMYGPLADFTCMICGCHLGRYPQATRGVSALCSACAAKPKSVNPNWLRERSGRP